MEKLSRKNSTILLGIVFCVLFSFFYLMNDTDKDPMAVWRNAQSGKFADEIQRQVLNSSDPRMRSSIILLKRASTLADFHPGTYQQLHTVSTVGGRTVQIAMFHSDSFSIPGDVLSIAYLVVDGRVRDWRSCWTMTRIGDHIPVVEDLDGDGQTDCGFAGRLFGLWGSLDANPYRISGDERYWFGAYRITPQGFRDLSVESRRIQLNRKTTSIKELSVRYDEIPEEVRCFEPFEVKMTFANRSERSLVLKKDFFKLEVEKFSYMMTFPDSRVTETLEFEETTTRTVLMVLNGYGPDETTMTVSLEPSAIR